MKKRPISVPAVLFAIVMLLSGVVVVLFTLLAPSLGPAGELARNLGFAFMVTGVVVVFQEAVIKRWDLDENEIQFQDIRQRVDALSGTVNSRSESLNDKVEGCFRNFEETYGTKALALRLVALQRAGYDSYHHWLVHTEPEDLFLAGHSVFHRIQIDTDIHGLGRLEDALTKKVLAGSTLRVIFLNPMWDFIKQIAEGEGQTYEKMMTDLAVTLGICRRLWRKLEEHGQLGIAGSVDIRVCSEVQQYAFHSVTNKVTGVRSMLVGLYFANSLGMNSPLFSVEQRDIQDIFTTHFVAIAKRSTSTSLLQYSPSSRCFNYDLYHHCRGLLPTCRVPQAVIDEQCPE